MWIGPTKNNKTKPLDFQLYQEPVKLLGVNLSWLSYNQDRIISLIFFVKIHKMDTKLNMWQPRDITLYGRTMFVKSLSISRIVYAANSLFKFLWKTEKR